MLSVKHMLEPQNSLGYHFVFSRAFRRVNTVSRLIPIRVPYNLGCAIFSFSRLVSYDCITSCKGKSCTGTASVIFEAVLFHR